MLVNSDFSLENLSPQNPGLPKGTKILGAYPFWGLQAGGQKQLAEKFP